ncbi:hypothetical protein GCM10023321_26100 [Pseudonocardia eucalypti]|uniref:Uncharacterized protein n=1 Tax=Pseudonocardia eucalypti TaxID=648755 RepID=A0ABP9PYM7_9PSEU
MRNGRKNELAEELFIADHLLHDPHVQAGPGPAGIAEAVRTHQESLAGYWEIERHLLPRRLDRCALDRHWNARCGNQQYPAD